MYLALSAAGEGRQQMGAIVPVGINRADVWVDTPLEARVVSFTPSLRGKNGNIPGILPNNQFQMDGFFGVKQGISYVKIWGIILLKPTISEIRCSICAICWMLKLP